MLCSNLTVLFLLSFVLLETSVLINLYLTAVFPRSGDEAGTSAETVRLFTSYDTNGDGVIDLWEFEAVRQRIDEGAQTVRNGNSKIRARNTLASILPHGN